ncbi:MAG TPA: HU family DNA-binding protein [Dongiaceae bacterium]|nr:HU family DNA-binding protein [Dongiaceae bacterium]
MAALESARFRPGASGGAPHHTVRTRRGIPVNKNDLIAEVADDTGLSKTDAAKAVDAVFDSITRALKKNQEIRLVGFGTFHVAKRAASKGRNPRTGEEIEIPASKQPKFKAGKGLKDAVN